MSPRFIAAAAVPLAALSLVTPVALTAPALAADGPPSYSVQFLGAGTPTAINDVDNTVVGVRTEAATGAQVPLVSTDGAPWSTLPTPAGWTGAIPTDVNDSGVVVGVATTANLGGRRAVRWTPSGTSYTVQVLPLLAGETTSYATAINDAGLIVGARAGLLGTPFGYGWVYSDAAGTQGLLATYGWDSQAPDDINNVGVVLDSTQTFDLATRTVTDVGSQVPAGSPLIGGTALTDAGQIVGESVTSGSLPTARVHRYTPGQGWQFIAGSSRYTYASDINAVGNLTYSEGLATLPALYIDGLGTFGLAALFDDASRAAGWTTAGGLAKLNDANIVTTAGRNTITGQSGTLLLRPSGSLQPPAAPTGLTATAHPATTSEPYVSIDLSWVNADPVATQSFELQRSLAAANAWANVELVPPATGTFHQDTTVAPATAYDYRVRAIGLGGPSAWSAVATATSPSVNATTMRVTGITLSATLSRGVVTASGVVTVRTPSGAAVRDATVAVRWSKPGGSTVTSTARTNSRGQASLSTTGSRGTYTLTVTGVTKTGYSFDAAGSVLSRSITR